MNVRTIAIMNNKGGVGKTVTSINLADILVRDHHKKVVVVDCDGQSSPEKAPQRCCGSLQIVFG